MPSISWQDWRGIRLLAELVLLSDRVRIRIGIDIPTVCVVFFVLFFGFIFMCLGVSVVVLCFAFSICVDNYQCRMLCIIMN